MKRLLVMLAFAAAVAVVAAIALASWGRTSSTRTEGRISPTNLPTAAPTGQMTLYGHIKALKRVGGHIEMRFDPAWVTEGLTAKRAFFADTGERVMPGKYYYIEEGHRLLTYTVAPTATIRIVTNNGTGPMFTPIKLSELMRIVNGGPHRKLWEPLSTGVWIRVGVATIREINQPYQS